MVGNCQVDQDERLDCPWSSPEQRHKKVQDEPWTGESRFWILSPEPASSVSSTANMPLAPIPETVPETPDARASCSDSPRVLSQAGAEPYPTENSNLQSLGPSTYAPIRVRQSKGSDTFVFRPVQTQAEDLRDVMVEISEERNQAQKRSRPPRTQRQPAGDSPDDLPPCGMHVQHTRCRRRGSSIHVHEKEDAEGIASFK